MIYRAGTEEQFVILLQQGRSETIKYVCSLEPDHITHRIARILEPQDYGCCPFPFRSKGEAYQFWQEGLKINPEFSKYTIQII